MKDKIKVAQFVDSYLPITDGVAMVVNNYASILTNHNQDCTVFAPKKGDNPGRVVNYDIVRCSGFHVKAIGYDCPTPAFDSKLKKHLMAADFDIFHAHSPFTMGQYAIKIARKRNVPIIGTFHSQYKEDFKKYLKSDMLTDFMVRYIVRFYNSVDKVWAVSHGAADILREYGCTQDIEVMINGTDLTYLANPEEIKRQVNAAYNLDSNETVLLFVGRLVSQKNIFMMADSLKLLLSQGQKFRMIIAGVGADQEKLENKIKELGIEDRVIFAGAIDGRENLAKLFMRADLFVFPSLYDTSGLVKIEAASQKTASVLVENTCAAEEVIDGENGFICSNTAESLAAKITEALSDRQKLSRVAEKAYETLYFSWDDIVTMAERKYKEAIEGHKSRFPVKK